MLAGQDPGIRLLEQRGRTVLHLTLGKSLRNTATTRVTTQRLGKAKIPGLPYVNPDGSPLEIDTDYFGKRRNPSNPRPGPFEKPGTGALTLRVW
jgi:hypothetical protein